MKNKLFIYMRIGIYKIICKINNKVYIGQSSNIDARWSHHRSEFKKETHHNKHLLNSVKKHGLNNFEFEIIEECSLEILTQREQYWKDYYSNITEVYNFGQFVESPIRGVPRKEETKKKISKTLQGRKHSEKTKQKMSLSKNGKTNSVEHNKKIKQSKKYIFKSVERIDIDTGEIKEYECIMDAARERIFKTTYNKLL